MEYNRIYQLSDEQLNVISSDLLEAIILLSGKKGQEGLLDELNNLNLNLIEALKLNVGIASDGKKALNISTKLAEEFRKISTEKKEILDRIEEIKFKELDVEKIKLDFVEKNEINNLISQIEKIVDNSNKRLQNVREIEKSVALELPTKQMELQSKINEAESLKIQQNKYSALVFGLGGFAIGILFTIFVIFNGLDLKDLTYFMTRAFGIN